LITWYFRRSEKASEKMNKILAIISALIVLAGCDGRKEPAERIPVATVGDKTLYFDEVPKHFGSSVSKTDSMAILQNYVNSWARKELLYLKAEENLSDLSSKEIDDQLQETRKNLVIYQYQRQMMLQRMDTNITVDEMEAYYAGNEKNFNLSSSIVKALFIKVPSEIPGIDRIRLLSRSSDQKDLQQLEGLCYQFAEKFDDFGDNWVTIDRLCVELPREIPNQDDFLRYNTWYETRDSSSVYMITIRDYRLRYSLAPFEYVKNDIKSIILNNRRFEFLQSLENGIYNEGLKANLFKTY
jgi:uncharacterized lipoprotein YajG